VRDIDISWLWIVAVLVVLFTCATAGKCGAKDTFYGVGVFGGEQWISSANPTHHTSAYNWQELQVRPIYGKHMDDRWDLWLEGHIGCLKWVDHSGALRLGANVMTSYDVFKYKQCRLFGEFGVGFGWASYTPSTNMLRNNVLGLIDVGIGIKVLTKEEFTLKIGPRFHHTSAVFAHDAGINTFGVMVSLTR